MLKKPRTFSMLKSILSLGNKTEAKCHMSPSSYFLLIRLIRRACYTHTFSVCIFFFVTFVTVVDLAVSVPLITGIFILLTFLPLFFFDPRISAFHLFFLRLPTDTNIIIYFNTFFGLGFYFTFSQFSNTLVPKHGIC